MDRPNIKTTLLHCKIFMTDTTDSLFTLHPQLNQDCIQLGQLDDCELLRFNGDAFDWFILVPRFADLREWHHLSADNQTAVFQTSMLLSQFIEKQFTPDKLNIAALGNMVPQLHIHHVARFKTDSAWPKPIWGESGGNALTDSSIDALKQQCTDYFGGHFKTN